ncbi:putative cytokinin riboside 5'-monophosphate phosphoribohydrolase [Rhodotorula toruloides]|nr:putative cytokinin riboside 5'-monophosphate phosphoribohydrolase [Rhodotorula toruloides]
MTASRLVQPEEEQAITVFCGSSPGKDSVYGEAADQLARALARRGVTLIFGGGTKGLMGRVSSKALDEGGKVHGIIPAAFLSAEAPDRADSTRSNEQETVVESMHERKTLMADLSYAFIGLPGGYGTLEEVAEMTTWSQIGVHLKPVVLLNINGFYSSLREFINHAISSGFISESNRNFLVFVDQPKSGDWGEAALQAIDDWKAKGAGGAVPYSFEWSEDRKKGREASCFTMSNSTSASSLLTPEDSAVLASTSTIQRVLIAQSVFEKGTNDFAAVAAVLQGHALLSDCSHEWFEPKNLSKIWIALVHNVGQDASVQHPPQAPALRKIAHKYYMDRVGELHAGMQLCQDQFRPAQTLPASSSMIDVKMEDVGVGALVIQLASLWQQEQQLAGPGASPISRHEHE